MIKEINKTELADMLGVNVRTISRLTLEQLEEKLLKKCWVLLKVEKKGRSMIYTLKYQEQDLNIKDFVEDEFNVKDGDKFMKHTSYRVDSIKKNYPLSAENIAEEIKVTGMTCRNWDDKLENKGVISKSDDYLYYFKYADGRCEQVDKKTYDNYCRVNRVLLLEMQDLYSRFRKYEISKGYFEINMDALKDRLKDGTKAYKLHRYELNENDPCYQTMKEYLDINKEK